MIAYMPARTVSKPALDSAPPEAPQDPEGLERYQSLQAAADRAAATVRARHREAGVSLVYGNDGAIVEELPDGTVRPFTESSPLRQW
jgi:hypothetical protein